MEHEVKNYPVDNEKIKKPKKPKKSIEEEIAELKRSLATAESGFVKAKEKRDKIAAKLAEKEKALLDISVSSMLAACNNAGISLDDATEYIKGMASKGE